ncbi:hypothetical protein [Mobiluncus curtisii]|uniref:hypothetical protein n=1 Tax=Mobiluncus curtisii TaxID=2051 RepID=UPI00242E434C|nr:hypothetical protein [Mobiluncus curtisii]
MTTSTISPLYESIAVGRVERHLRAALVEAQEALAHCRGLAIDRFGNTYGLTVGAVDALIDALTESEFWGEL